jgi:hypothetical protein
MGDWFTSYGSIDIDSIEEDKLAYLRTFEEEEYITAFSNHVGMEYLINTPCILLLTSVGIMMKAGITNERGSL